MRQDQPDNAVQSAPEAGEAKPGWFKLEAESLPKPTYWPAVMAVALMGIFWGIVTSPLVTAGGIILFIVSIAGWIGDLWHGHEEDAD
jgi:hypothetical protein